MNKPKTDPPAQVIDDLVKLSFFADVGKAIAAASSLNETLNVVMKQIGEIFAPLNWSLLLRDFKTGELKFTIVTGTASANLRGKILPKGIGVAGWIAENGRSVIIEDVARDNRFSPEMDKISDFVTESIIGVPLISKKKVFGVIELINKLEGGPFTALDLKVLTIIADFAAIAIEKSYYLAALKRLATTDELTGLPNRRNLLKALETENQRCRRHGSVYVMLLLDIDGFKSINDTYGHAAGDSILRKVADILRKETRSVDTPCRFGGDEFIVLLPETKMAAGIEVRNRIQKAFETFNEAASIGFTVSIGIQEGTTENFEEILEKVDSSMYRHKLRKIDVNYAHVDENLGMFLDEEKTAKEDFF